MKQYHYHLAPKKDKAKVQSMYIEAKHFEEAGYLPEGLWEYSNIEVLGIRGWVERLPEDLHVKLPKLKALNIAFAKANCLPDSLGQCQHLEKLWISVSDAPIQVPDSLSQLTQLKILALTQCHLAQIPPILTQLPALEELRLSENQIKASLPKQYYWKKLKTLFLWGNELEQIPAWVYEHQQLGNLNLYGNRIQHIDAALERLQHLKTLFIIGNQLRALPDALAKLPNLSHLFWQDNPCGWIHPVLFQLNDTVFDPLNFQRPTRKKQAKAILAIRKLLTKKDIPNDAPIVTDLCAILNDQSPTDHLSNRAILEAYLLGYTPLKEACMTLITERLQPFQAEAFKAGNELLILGKTIKTKAVISDKLKELGIQVAAKKTEQTTHVLVGKNIKKTAALEDCDLVILQENQLNQFLDEYAPDYLVEASEEQADQTNNVKTLLWSFDEDSISVALQLLKGGGVPKDLITSLFAIHKFSANAKIVRQSKKLLELNASPALLERMKKRFSMKQDQQNFWSLKEYIEYICPDTELQRAELTDFGFRFSKGSYPFSAIHAEGIAALEEGNPQKKRLAAEYWKQRSKEGVVGLSSGDPKIIEYLFTTPGIHEVIAQPADFLYTQHSIAPFTNLQRLVLSHRQGQLRLPPDFGQLPNLHTLKAIDIVGIRPDALEQLQQLPALHTFIGQADRFRLAEGWFGLAQIEHLELGGQRLDLSIVDLSTLSNLKTLKITSAQSLEGAVHLFEQLEQSPTLEQVSLYQALEDAYQAFKA